MLSFLENFYTYINGALKGEYGWLSEIFAIAFLVLIFNCVVKLILKKLHEHFKQQNRVWKDSFVKALYKPLSYYTWFFAGIHALNLMFIRFQNQISFDTIQTVLWIGGILSIAWFFLRWKRYTTSVLLQKSRNQEITMDPGKVDAIDKVLTVFIAFITLLFILEVTEHSFNTLLAFGGVGGLAIAFASQEIIANFFGGFMVYLTQPFGVGDWINIPERNVEGIVEEIGWNTTRVRTLDKRPLYLPNSTFSKLILMNPSRMTHRQIKETLNLRYEDIHKLKEIMKEIKAMLQDHEDIDQHQNIVVSFSAFGQYSLEIILFAFTRTTNYAAFMKIKEEILFKVLDIVKEHGAAVAMPTHHVLFQPDEAHKGFVNL